MPTDTALRPERLSVTARGRQRTCINLRNSGGAIFRRMNSLCVGVQMGAWGVAVFSDDLAADVRDEFRDLIGAGLSSTEAVEKLLGEYASSVDDDNEKSVFWIALALTQWKLGHLEERTKNEALRLIAAGEDLKRWDDPNDRKKRAAVLVKVREQLLSPQPPPKRVIRTIKGANDWAIGEVVGL